MKTKIKKNDFRRFHIKPKKNAPAAQPAKAERRLNKAEIRKYQKELQEIHGRLTGRAPEVAEAPVGGDEADVVAGHRHLEAAFLVRGNSNALLVEVGAALRRIENGTYGVCEGTGAQISRARLDGVPWARFTLEFQREVESGLRQAPVIGSAWDDSDASPPEDEDEGAEVEHPATEESEGEDADPEDSGSGGEEE